MTRTCLLVLSVFIFLAGALSTQGASLFDSAAALSPAAPTAALPKGLERLPPPGAGSRTPGRTAAERSHFRIDISELVVTLAGKSQREIDDQLRDWAIYGTLVQLGLSPQQLVASTQHLAPVRLPYLDDSFVFTYGRGRRAIIADNAAVLFYQQGDADKQRTLGRLADQVRMELGHIPDTVHVFRFAADLPAGKLVVERESTLPGAAMFSRDTGYFELAIQTAADLEEFLKHTDSLSTTYLKDGNLMLGGRQYPRSRSRNVELADVAALYQAHGWLEKRHEQEKAELAAINTEYGEMQEQAARTSAFLGASRAEALRATYEARASRIQHAPAEPGFSLDPQWNVPRLLPVLERLIETSCTLPGSCLELRQVAANVRAAGDDVAAQQAALQSLELIIDDGKTSDLESLRQHMMAELLGKRFQMQCARYDGPLQGTRVGMNLFYTDLLAKLWMGVDLYHSAPVKEVPGFLSMPRMTLEPVFRAEILKLPGTRIWFGPRTEAYALSQDELTLWFQPISTRVYAAGHNPANPAQESQPAERSRRSIGWWDKHYAEVADYEQEYYVQNEIMKWALVTTWLRARYQAYFLADVPVDKSQRFDSWYEKQKKSLRYKYPLKLRPRSEWVGETECLDLQKSAPYEGFVGDGKVWQVSGGVSVAGRDALAAATRIELRIPWAERMTRLAVPGQGGRAAGTASRVWPKLEAEGRVLAEATAQTKWRTGASNLQLGNLTLRGEQGAAGGTRLALSGQHGAIGEFSVMSRGQEVKLGWRPGPIEQGRNLAEQTLAGGGGKLPPPPSGRPAIQLPDEGSWLFPGKGGDKSVKLSLGSYEPGKLPEVKGPLFTAQRQGGRVAVAQAEALGGEEFTAVVDRYAWQRVSFSKEGEVSARAFSKTGPPSGATPTLLDGYPELRGALRTADGTVYIPRPTADAARAGWRSLSPTRGSPTGVARETLVAASAPTQEVHVATAAVARGQLAEPLRYVAEDGPGQVVGRVQEIRRTLLADGERALISGDGAGAGRLFHMAGDMGRTSPKLLMQRGIAEIMEGDAKVGLQRLLDATKSMDKEGLAFAKHAVEGADTARLGDVRDVVATVANRKDGLPAGMMNRVVWVSDGEKPLSAFKLERPLEGTMLSQAERSAVARHPDEVVLYLDDRFSLSREDLVAAPAESLAEVARRPTVAFREIRVMPTGDYRPGVLMQKEGGTNFRRLDLVEQPNTTNFGRRAIVIVNCDQDGDGVVSAQEREQCAA